MKREITVLDQNTIDKIAAGEVVERPSSVVKELVENAMDAGATAVTVEIKDGGKSLIRITDNGSGIETDQVRMAFLRHATSKIEKVEDLEHISSLGFRGEALSSIAAVSQVEVITKTASAMSGCRYIIEGGVEKGLEEIGAPEGTTFLVRNLFFNTPARSKFLKTDTTEAGYISSLMEQMALAHPEISFKYIQNGQVKLHTSGNYSRKDVIYHIYGREITRELLELHCENEFMTLEGFVGKPTLSRGNRNFENYSVNGRYVKDKIITRAIEDAYKGFLMQHKFPFAVLQIRMEGNDLDVNVHPAKMEVRFSRGQDVYDTIFHGIQNALRQQEMIPEVELEKRREMPPKKEPVSRGSFGTFRSQTQKVHGAPGTDQPAGPGCDRIREWTDRQPDSAGAEFLQHTGKRFPCGSGSFELCRNCAGFGNSGFCRDRAGRKDAFICGGRSGGKGLFREECFDSCFREAQTDGTV